MRAVVVPISGLLRAGASLSARSVLLVLLLLLIRGQSTNVAAATLDSFATIATRLRAGHRHQLRPKTLCIVESSGAVLASWKTSSRCSCNWTWFHLHRRRCRLLAKNTTKRRRARRRQSSGGLCRQVVPRASPVRVDKFSPLGTSRAAMLALVECLPLIHVRVGCVLQIRFHLEAILNAMHAHQGRHNHLQGRQTATSFPRVGLLHRGASPLGLAQRVHFSQQLEELFVPHVKLVSSLLQGRLDVAHAQRELLATAKAHRAAAAVPHITLLLGLEIPIALAALPIPGDNMALLLAAVAAAYASAVFRRCRFQLWHRFPGMVNHDIIT